MRQSGGNAESEVCMTVVISPGKAIVSAFGGRPETFDDRMHAVRHGCSTRIRAGQGTQYFKRWPS
jgi:hypothetical protein